VSDGRTGPVVGCNFRVEIVDGNGRAHEVGCAEVCFPTLGVAAGADRAQAAESLVLRRAADGDRTLQQWWSRARDGRAATRRSVRVTLLAADHERVVKRWRFRGARPAALHYSSLDAMTSTVVMESLAVAFDTVDID